MKKLFVITAFVAALLVAEKAQAQLNLHVDYSPELIKTYTPTADTTLFFHGFSFGLSWEFILNDNLSLTAGAQYRMNMKDDSEHIYQGTHFVHHVTREQQKLVDLPILLRYKMALGDNGTFSPFAGPMLSYGINGKTTEQWLYPIDTEISHEWYEGTGFAYRPNSQLNVYAMAGAEFEFKQFTVTLGGRYGFLNLNKRNTGTTTKAYGFFLSFGHTF